MKFNRMKSIKRLCLFIAVVGLLSACNTVSKKAPVEERSYDAGKDGSKNQVRPFDPRTQYVVKKGDTLYRIAAEKGQSYSDLVTWNKLSNPNDIKIDQVLLIVPPESASLTTMQSGVTSGIVNPSGVSMRPLGGGSSGSTAPSSNNKNAPRADKRPYSEAALAELKKADSETTALKPTEVPKDNVADKSSGRTVDRVSPPVIVDEISWAWPVDGKVISTFDDSKNKGIDISGKLGQDIFAAGSGVVMYAGSGIRGYGNLVIIKHSNNLLSAYAHNKVVVVKEKQAISKGQKIAEMGSSDSDSVKLHFEIRQQGKPVDPLKFLPGRSGQNKL